MNDIYRACIVCINICPKEKKKMLELRKIIMNKF